MSTNLMDYAWYKQRGLGKDEEESIDQKFFDEQCTHIGRFNAHSFCPSLWLNSFVLVGEFRRLVTGCIFPLTDRIVFDLSDIKLSSNTYDFMMSGR